MPEIRSARRRGVLAAAVLVVLASVASSEAVTTEVGPFLSHRFGGLELPTGILCDTFGPDCPTRTESDDGLAWGLEIGAELREQWWMELRLSKQDVDFGGESSAGAEATWDRFLVGLEHRWSRPGAWRPFLTLAIGWTDFSGDLEAVGNEEGVGLTHPTLGIGSGILLRRGERLGLRLEARLSWTDLPSELGSDLVQAGLGMSFRLRFPDRIR